MTETRLNVIKKLSIFSIIMNIILSTAKILIGFLFSSLALVSDGLHSFSDILLSVLVFICAFISSPKPDKKHNYGHEKYENIISQFLAIILFAIATVLAYNSIRSLIYKDYKIEQDRINLMLIVIIICILMKEFMYRVIIHYAKKIKSDALTADAWHNRMDSLTSFAVLLGLIGARFNLLFAESLSALLVSIIIMYFSVRIYLDAIKGLVDYFAGGVIVEKMKNNILSNEGVMGISKIMTRKHGYCFYVDVDIFVNGTLSVVEASKIAKNVNENLEKNFDIKHCNVCILPYSQFSSN